MIPSSAFLLHKENDQLDQPDDRQARYELHHSMGHDRTQGAIKWGGREIYNS